MTNNLCIYVENFNRAIREVLLQLDPEAAQLFLDRFEEIINEQKCTQKNSGTSR